MLFQEVRYRGERERRVAKVDIHRMRKEFNYLNNYANSLSANSFQSAYTGC
jgi:hypothetical protein